MESGWSATDSDCDAATETAAEEYSRNERVGSSVAGEVSATASDASHHFAVAIVWTVFTEKADKKDMCGGSGYSLATMAAQRDSELAVKKLRDPCGKVLESLT